MKYLIALLFAVSVSAFAETDSYQIKSSYDVGSGELEGDITFLIDNGKEANFSMDYIESFKVAVQKQTENQVLVSFNFTADTTENQYQTDAQVLIDLNKEVELKFGNDLFRFFISKKGT
ncbi:hypothetical protein CF168_08465 [Shewanella bicestrii]|uniref:DUF2057 domain-containing protein n=1 Tax=Shewanella bicestrii TaxID=2018305 RepID=A0A220ULZ8_9GAMM|nr:hypothetical protein [Shewanella bicestrii]ASK68912.1 hypothetical protein CF168_08465 [Shewanella bicestrii]